MCQDLEQVLQYLYVTTEILEYQNVYKCTDTTMHKDYNPVN